MVKPVIVETEHGSFWSCLDVIFDEDGNSKYKNLIVRHQGKVVLGLANNDEITEYLMSSVKLHCEIMKAEVTEVAGG